MNNCVFARSRNAHRLYVWQNGVFLFWMDAKKRWARSDLVQHLYDEAYCKDPDVTPEEWFVDSSDFTILDEYEVPADALAALQEVSPLVREYRRQQVRGLPSVASYRSV